jgi:peptide/nickel transport system substrate-binding protein
LALAAGAALLTAAAAAKRPARPAGTLTVSGVPSTADPALEPSVYQHAACIELVSYPARDVRHGGLRLVPEAAAALPRVSADGRRYVFSIRRGLRFYPSGKPLTARDFAWVLYRDLAEPASNGAALLGDIVGAKAVVAGGPRAALRGVRAAGRRLTVELDRPVPDFLSRLASPSVCALPSGTPVSNGGLAPPIPSAGPYYVASLESGFRIVLERNPRYRGPRPHRFATILGRPPGIPGGNDVRVVSASYLEEVLAQRDPRRTRLVGGTRPVLSYVALNWNRPLFRDHSRLARAVAYALDRTALVRAHAPVGGVVTDHMLPAPLPGKPLYPLRPDLPRARALAAGLIGDGRISVATCDTTDEAAGDVVVANLEAIGFRPTMTHFNCATAFYPIDRDVLLTTQVPDLWSASGVALYEPASWLRGLVGTNPFNYGGGPKTNFAVPAWTKRIAALARVRNPAARSRAAARLDRALMRAFPPLVPYMLRNDRVLLSNRVGCFTYQPVYGLELGAFCPR